MGLVLTTRLTGLRFHVLEFPYAYSLQECCF